MNQLYLYKQLPTSRQAIINASKQNWGVSKNSHKSRFAEKEDSALLLERMLPFVSTKKT